MKEFVEKLIGKLKTNLNKSEKMYQDFLDKGNLACVYDISDIQEERIKTIKEIIKIVNQLAKEYNNGWILCAERLPEKYGEYLCCDTYGNFVLGFPSESDTSDTGFIVETEHEYCYDIIAWMELPEKYKEKKNGSS